jgi:Type III restriction enzyme, res subunit/Helicase C-terminal domain
VKFQYPRDVQSQVWSKWFERRNEKSLVIKMNTGSGKTVVGLLILKSCINEGKSPVAYICPDKFLVDQVIDAAKELGIEATEDVHSHRFLSGKAILVTNIYKLVNGKSVFGIGDEGIKLKVSSFIIDDAHACLETIEDQFTMSIPSNADSYEKIYEIFKSSLYEQGETKALEIEAGESSCNMRVPYWVWQEKISDVTRLLLSEKDSNTLKFVWPLLKDNLKLCNCVISGSSIEISPHHIPMHIIPTITDADRRVFMTATLVDDSILASHFGVTEEFIQNPVVPDSAGDIGDRMILLPQVINPELSDDKIKAFCKEKSLTINVVVIVPSVFRSKYWEDCADLVLNKQNLYEGIEQLKNGHVGLVVLINRYDGIDLPGDACRLLIIDGFPDVRRQIDLINQGMLLGSTRQSDQIIQKVEQGMGRGIRSNDDYCTVFLIGKDLASQLYSQGAIEKLSPGTKVQMQLSEQVANQLQDKDISEISQTINYCLERNEDWVRTSRGVLAGLKYTDTVRADPITLALRKAYDFALTNSYEAENILSKMVNDLAEPKLKGFYKQTLAEYVNLHNKIEAQKIQLSASSDNLRVLKPIQGVQYHRLTSQTNDQVVSCINYFGENFNDPNKLVLQLGGILDALQFREGTSNKFEENLKLVANFLGFSSHRPEQEYGKGPDVLWTIGSLNYLVIECKNEATSTTIIKDYCNQLNGSCNWFENKYDSSCSYTPIMVHPATVFEYAASPKQSIRIITGEKLTKFCKSVRDFAKAIAGNNKLGNQEFIRQQLIANKLRADDIVSNYTEGFRVKQ